MSALPCLWSLWVSQSSDPLLYGAWCTRAMSQPVVPTGRLRSAVRSRCIQSIMSVYDVDPTLESSTTKWMGPWSKLRGSQYATTQERDVGPPGVHHLAFLTDPAPTVMREAHCYELASPVVCAGIRGHSPALPLGWCVEGGVVRPCTVHGAGRQKVVVPEHRPDGCMEHDSRVPGTATRSKIIFTTKG